MLVTRNDLRDMSSLAKVLSPSGPIEYADDVPPEFQQAAEEYIQSRRRVLDAWKAMNEENF